MSSLRKQTRESQRAERAMGTRRDRERDDGRGVGILPEGTGWTGTDDLAWTPLRPAVKSQVSSQNASDDLSAHTRGHQPGEGGARQ